MNILIDLIPSAILIAILFFLWRNGNTRILLPKRGARLIIGGLILFLFSSIITFIHQHLLFVNDGGMGFLEGMSLFSEMVMLPISFLFLGIGIFRWMPGVTSIDEVERFSQELVNVYLRLEIHNQNLKEERELSLSLSQNVNDAIISIDENGIVSFWNLGASKIFGYRETEMLGQSITRIMPEPYRKPHMDAIKRVNITGTSKIIESVIEANGLRKNGQEFPIDISLATWTLDDKRYYVAIIRDISERKESEASNERLQQSRVAISSLLKIALEPITLEEQLEKSLDVILSVPWLSVQSKGSIFLMDEETGELVLTVQRGLDPHLLTACARFPIGHCLCGRAAKEKKLIYSAHLDDHHVITFNGIKPHGHYCIPVLLQDKILGVVNCYICDSHIKNPEETEFLQSMANTIAGLIDRKQMEQRLQRLAHYDFLTGLPNRMLFMEQLKKQTARSRRDKSMLAVLFMDLDRFKEINDTLGHDVGDMLLMEVSTRIKTNVRQSDMVARLGGDEFTVFLTLISKKSDAGLVAQKIITELEKPFFLKGHKCNIGSSIGISFFPVDGNSPDELIKQADIAMYFVKNHARNSFIFFEDWMRTDKESICHQFAQDLDG